MTALARTLGRAIQACRLVVSRVWTSEARFKGARVARSVQFWGRPIISLAPESSMTLADGVVVSSATRSAELGAAQPSVLRTLTPGATLEIGPRVGMTAAVICAGHSIHIGEGTLLGAGAMVVDTDFHVAEGAWEWRHTTRAEARPVVIGRGVFIGARAIVLKGVCIGDRAMVGAGAVVTRDVPAGATVAGNPAAIVTPRSPDNRPER